MLTCKVGNTIINCFDGTYDKYTLKEWSDKNKLICPDCGKPYEYCHGKIINPYFRHKEKSECEGLYHEPETEEHIKGKIALYNWLLRLQDNGLVHNVKLEAFIPETKQRPDLYFEKDGHRYVIEYQCSPIASEYLERHELYKLAGVIDIWVLGINNYGLKFCDSVISHKTRYKTIEENTSVYFNSSECCFIFKNNFIKKYLPYNAVWLNDYYKFDINDISFGVDYFIPTPEAITYFIQIDKAYHNELIENDLKEQKESNLIEELLVKLNNRYSNIQNGVYYFEGVRKYNNYYNHKIILYKKYNTHIDSLFGSYMIYTFFIKSNKIDCCEEYTYTTPFRGKRGGIGWRRNYGYKNISSLYFDQLDILAVENFIIKMTSDYIRNSKYSKGV